MSWGVAVTAFGGALVEFVEAAVITVTAAAMAGWGVALKGAAAAALILVAAVSVLGTAVLRFVPLAPLRWVVGALLLLFGVKWLAKATLRLGRPQPGGHQEGGEVTGARAAFLTSFNGVLLEGAEVVFIVLALGTTGRSMRSAVAGAAVAAVLCVIGAVAARRALGSVPDVALKFVVGVMLTSFGTFWMGEAMGIPWWGASASLGWIVAGNLALAWAAVWSLRRGPAAQGAGGG